MGTKTNINKENSSTLEYSFGQDNIVEIRSKSSKINKGKQSEIEKVSAFAFDDVTARRLMDIKPDRIRKDATITSTSTFKAIKKWASHLLESAAAKMIFA